MSKSRHTRDQLGKFILVWTVIRLDCRTGHLISKLKGSLERIAARLLLVMKINLTNNMRWKSIGHSDNSLGDYAYHVKGVS